MWALGTCREATKPDLVPAQQPLTKNLADSLALL